jgi:hypothetical protein
MPAKAKTTTPETVKKMLRTLKPNPLIGKNRITDDVIAAYCARAGRKFADPVSLGIGLRKKQMGLA